MEFFESLEQKCRDLVEGKNFLNDPEPITAIKRQIQLLLHELDGSRNSFNTQFKRLEKKRLEIESEKLNLAPQPNHSMEIWRDRKQMANSLNYTLSQIEQSVGYLVSDYNRKMTEIKSRLLNEWNNWVQVAPDYSIGIGGSVGSSESAEDEE
tara:strand:- start:3604 stop:4059 length:456 start_codon:yes stop_codon:yes gene_type:complete